MGILSLECYPNSKSMKKVVFADTEEFYQELVNLLKSGEKVEVITSYKRYQDLPPRLIQIFELHKHRTNDWVNVYTGAFIAHSVAPVGLNLKVLIVLGSTTVGAGMGAGIGALAGGVGAVPGAAIGAALGLVAGTVAAVLSDRSHQAVVEIDRSGNLRIKISPA